MTKKGMFIVIEGLDGSGKSTQIDMLKNYFEKEGLDSIFTREPGGTELGEIIREVILNKNNFSMTPVTEMFLYVASRAQHVSEKILPALDSGNIVVCDRFVQSSISYQGYGRGLGEIVSDVNDIALQGLTPDLIIYLDIEPSESKIRIGSKELDRIELEKIDFYSKVREGYLEQAKNNDKFLIIDGNLSVDEISKKIIKRIENISL